MTMEMVTDGGFFPGIRGMCPVVVLGALVLVKMGMPAAEAMQHVFGCLF